MAAYLVADGDWKDTDSETQSAFIQASRPVILKYGGKSLTPPEAPERLECEWSPVILTIVEFPDVATIRRMWDSPEYKEAAAIRRNSKAVFKVLLVEGA